MTEQGETWADFIREELKAEDARRSSIGTSARAVLTTSAGFLALLVAIRAFVAGEKDLPTTSPVYFLLALVLFTLSGIGGLMAAFPSSYVRTTPESMRAMLGVDHWGDPEIDARNIVAKQNVATLASMRKGNNSRALILIVSMALGVLASAVLALAIAYDVASRL